MEENETATELLQFDLPDHANELAKVEEIIGKYKTNVREIIQTKTITDTNHDKYYEEVVRALDYVGKLSMSAFNIEDELEELYIKQYIHAPALAKSLWLEHYGKIHRPYNLLKNRCFKLLEELDDSYRDIYKKQPPNWNI